LVVAPTTVSIGGTGSVGGGPILEEKEEEKMEEKF